MTSPRLRSQPSSPVSAAKHSRLRGATAVDGICPYCAVGCGLRTYVKSGRIINIEGNPDSPINAGTLCPKGANTFQLIANPNRITRVCYRAPYSDHWENRPLDWALDQIARRIQTTRERDFQIKNRRGQAINALTSVGTLGGATLDNEENYLIKKLFGGGLGMVSIENQARI